MPELLTTNDMANTLKVSRRTIEKLLSCDRFPRPIWIGGSRRWRKRDLELFLSARGDIGEFRKLENGPQGHNGDGAGVLK